MGQHSTETAVSHFGGGVVTIDIGLLDPPGPQIQGAGDVIQHI
jgi:hypothetical protein